MARMTLTEIGRKHKTDKVDVHHTFCGVNYLDVYEKYFAPLRDLDSSIFEIGIKKGASLRVWEEYFTIGRVVGLDINANCASMKFNRARIVIGDQTDPKALQQVYAANGYGLFDVILDDGSHINRLTLHSFELLWAHVKPGGYYILEDMKCTYLGDNLISEQKRGGWHYKYERDNESNDRSEIDRTLLRLVCEMDHLRGDVRTIHIHPMTYVIEKV